MSWCVCWIWYKLLKIWIHILNSFIVVLHTQRLDWVILTIIVTPFVWHFSLLFEKMQEKLCMHSIILFLSFCFNALKLLVAYAERDFLVYKYHSEIGQSKVRETLYLYADSCFRLPRKISANRYLKLFNSLLPPEEPLKEHLL